jgi:hypothetical protein
MTVDPLTLLGVVTPDGPGSATLLTPASRYHNIPLGTRVLADGRSISFLKRRFPVDPSEMRTLAEHHSTDSDRLDRLAAHYLGDPTLFWQICDANLALHPDEVLQEAGRLVLIAMPEAKP